MSLSWIGEWRMERVALVCQWSSLLLQLQVMKNPHWDFISSLFLLVEHLYSVSSNKSIQPSNDFPWLQTPMEFLPHPPIAHPRKNKKGKKKTLLKERKNPIMISALGRKKMQSVGKNGVCSIEARSKPRCQSGSGWGIEAGILRTTTWDGLCEHARDLNGRLLDTLTNSEQYVVSREYVQGCFVCWTLKMKILVTPRRDKIQQNTLLALTNPVHYN